MCLKLRFILEKIIFVSLILCNAGLDCYEICQNSKYFFAKTETPHYGVCIVSFIIHGILVCFSIVAIFGVLTEQLLILQVFLGLIIVYCFTKMVVWIVCGNYLDKLDPNFDHSYTHMTMALALLNLFFSTRLCMRIDESTRQ
ncbi:uncharacterized protein Dana_GF27542 [Drosophila ananassae]|uniref:Uncharacterized protein n=1 Tax=Drosophila ananassae TaxID=7217 RepID=A0A0P8XVH0_DROAN|nr:uncharacterized protein LOC26514512 isoform X1 [Drosophila ananassae]KPU78705.1 uncharacterized protein Dana_GF27542 [Drosophila ananassae]